MSARNKKKRLEKVKTKQQVAKFRKPVGAELAAAAVAARSNPLLQRMAPDVAVSVLPDGLTARQRTVQKCGEYLKEKISNDESFLANIRALRAYRQGFAIAHGELAELVGTYTDAPDCFLDFALQYALYLASEKFDGHELMQAMIHYVNKWMADVVDKYTDREEKERKAILSQEEKERRASSVDLGLAPSVFSGEEIKRGRSVVFVGHSRAVVWLMNRITKTATEKHSVARFAMRATREAQHKNLTQISLADWEGCCDSQVKLATVLADKVLAQFVRPLDLFVCDDLAAACAAMADLRPAPVRAEQSHKLLRQFCENAAAVLVGGVLLDEVGEVDVSAAQYEPLKSFTLLCPVHTFETETGIRICVGRSGHVDLTVDKDELPSWSVIQVS